MSRHDFVARERKTGKMGPGRYAMVDLVAGREVVPAIWVTPASDGPVPAVLLLHGFSSSKERMAQSVGRALVKHGIASLAVDLPFHGERGDARGIPRNPIGLAGAWRNALRESRDATRWVSTHEAVDPDRIGVIGYSLGGFLALMVAAEESCLRVVALAAAGDLPDRTPFVSMARALVDPLRAVRLLDGRPLLLVNGRRDHTTRPAEAKRLFEAAEQPKTMMWYDGGHWPPSSAIEDAAGWMAGELEGLKG